MSEPLTGWWSIDSEELMTMLRRVEAGESADLVYAEFYANSDHEFIGGDDE
jgi:hypothetical protein